MTGMPHLSRTCYVRYSINSIIIVARPERSEIRNWYFLSTGEYGMCACMARTFSRKWINQVWLPIVLLMVSWREIMFFSAPIRAWRSGLAGRIRPPPPPRSTMDNLYTTAWLHFAMYIHPSRNQVMFHFRRKTVHHCEWCVPAWIQQIWHRRQHINISELLRARNL